MTALGFDTSNYTTSAAVYDGAQAHQSGRLLSVPEGAVGLRQSEALFQHVRNLPERVAELDKQGLLHDIAVVGASTAPRAVEGSYMPCFLAGAGQARCAADLLHVPLFTCSHQQGHLAAACWSAGQEELLDGPMLAWHLSGGTTELLYCRPEGSNVRAEILGGTSDISAGQLIDRTGKYLRLAFPAGKALDALAGEEPDVPYFPVKCREMTFSLSGVENQVKAKAEQGMPREEVAAFALRTIAHAVRAATDEALRRYPGLPVVCSGGVAGNRMLRRVMADAVFAKGPFSADNAAGVAILAHRWLERGC